MRVIDGAQTAGSNTLVAPSYAVARPMHLPSQPRDRPSPYINHGRYDLLDLQDDHGRVHAKAALSAS